MDISGLTPEEMVVFKKGRIAADKFRTEYDVNHKRCPACGSKANSQTYIGHIVQLGEDGEVSNADTYQDDNRVECCCGWVGIVHDLLKD